MQGRFRLSAVIALCLTMSACGGGGYSGGGNNGGTPTASYTVGGTVNGLVGTVVLQNNSSADQITISNNAGAALNFTFGLSIASGGAYNVTVVTQPTNQTCTVANGTGTIGNAALTNVAVNCGGNAMPPAAVSQISASVQHTCAVLDGGALKCWGLNDSGQLGIGSRVGDIGGRSGEMGTSLRAVDLGSGRIVSQVAPGSVHTCASSLDGSVKCWGVGGYLGLGDIGRRGISPGEMGDNLPTVDTGSGLVVKLVTGQGHTCALTNEGAVKCWAEGFFGELGTGTKEQRGDQPGEMGVNLPAIDLGTGAVAADISAGNRFTCARLTSGAVKCWGINSTGQLGITTTDLQNRGDDPSEMGDALPALDLGAGRTATAVATGGFFACALLDDSTVKCWGSNSNGQLGLGSTTGRLNPSPTVDLGSGLAAVELAAGRQHVCARLNNGGVKCWGANGSGQLGLGDTESRGDEAGEMGDNLPQVDLGGRIAMQISAGLGDHTCVLLDDATVKCWGDNSFGQLGLGDKINRGDSPNQMGVNLPIVDVGSGDPEPQIQPSGTFEPRKRA